MSITLPLGAVKQRFSHDICGLIFQFHLRVTVGALQEGGIRVACQLSYCLLVHAMVE